MRETEYLLHLENDLYEKDRIRARFIIDKGKLLDVMYQYETLDDGEWVAVVRFDCSHGIFHKDLIYPNGYKEKIKVEVFSTKEFSAYAKQYLDLRWRFYKEWYFKLKRRRR